MASVGFDRSRQALTAAKRRQPKLPRGEFFALARASVRFGASNPALYRLTFNVDAGNKPADVHLNERALAAFGSLIELLQ